MPELSLPTVQLRRTESDSFEGALGSVGSGRQPAQRFVAGELRLAPVLVSRLLCFFFGFVMSVFVDLAGSCPSESSATIPWPPGVIRGPYPLWFPRTRAWRFFGNKPTGHWLQASFFPWPEGKLEGLLRPQDDESVSGRELVSERFALSHRVHLAIQFQRALSRLKDAFVRPFEALWTLFV